MYIELFMFLKKQGIKNGHSTIFIFSQILIYKKNDIPHILKFLLETVFVKQSVFLFRCHIDATGW